MNGGAIPSAEQMQQAALRLGKALNDPIKGVGALARVGVQFTKAQVKQIKTLVATGHTLQAQKVILAEIRKEFGGSAAAAGTTLAGQLEKLRNIALNLGASIVGTLMPDIQRLVKQLTDWLSKSKNQQQVLNTVKAAASAVATAVRVLTGAFRVLTKITGSTTNTFKVLLAAFVAFKALKLISYIAGMTKAMRGFGAASAAANAGGLGGGAGGGRFGKALGAAGAVAVGAPLVAGAIRKIPGFDSAMKGFGGKIFDITHPGAGGAAIHIEHFHSSAQNPRQLENDLLKRARGRPHRRRGS